MGNVRTNLCLVVLLCNYGETTDYSSVAVVCGPAKVEGANCRSRMRRIDSTKESVQRCRCHRGLIMNIHRRLTFVCRWDDLKAKGVWTSRTIEDSNILLDDMRCLDTCDINFAIPKDMHVDVHMNTGIQWYRSSPRPIFVGEELHFRCPSGYVHKERPYLNDYDIDYGMEGNFTDSLLCLDRGKWDVPLDGLNFDGCLAITCSASQYRDLSNGYIVNYRETYRYLETLELRCDPGYKPISRMSITCKHVGQFQGNDFGCEEIYCPAPANPLQGQVHYSGRSIGDNATFICDKGTLYGKETWTCQETGHWDNECVVCVSDDDHCPPPCMTTNLMMTTYPFDFSFGSKLRFRCLGHTGADTAIERECLLNGMWTGNDLDCTGIKYFDPRRTWHSLTAAMDKIRITNQMTLTYYNPDGIKGRNPRDPLPPPTASGRNMPFYYHLYLTAGVIKVNGEEGTDVYFLLDVSGSVDKDMFDKTRQFIKALLPSVGVSGHNSGTRIAIFPFASRVFKYYDGTMDNAAFKDYKEAQDMVDRLNRTVVAENTYTGTAIADALDEVYLSIMTKLVIKDENRIPDRAAVILISDGQYTTSGNPQRNAEMIKNISRIETEIYSIFIGKPDVKVGRRVMEEIASDIENEEHFFAINSEDSDLTRVTRAMIGEEPEPLYCGKTDINKIGLRNGSITGEQAANGTAWPWMVEILRKHQHICGGSIIDRHWVLTAAHCFDDGTDGMTLKMGSVKLNDLDADPHFIRRHEIIIHENYKQSTTRYAHDIALIKLRNPIALHELVPVCYKPGDDGSKDVLFGPGRFGQVIGWGSKDTWMDDTLQQMQMQVQEDADCPTEPAKRSHDIVVFNSTYMFCAGGIDDMTRAVVDTHGGDSGGPFMMQYVNEPGRFRQVGIVSFGAPKLNKNVHYGFYTKVSAYIEWIDDKTKAHMNLDVH